MSAARPPRHSLSRLRHRSGWGWLLALCWLLLNAQLAIAGHRCDLPVTAPTPAMQHQSHLMQPAHTPQAAEQQSSLCDKHCVPDSVSQDFAALAALAPPASSELSLAERPQPLLLASAEWFSPPVAGPPAEIRFCRFRE